MRARLLIAVALLALLGLAAVGRTQPPNGIVRPATEQGKSLPQLGAELYAGNCASCHGTDGAGVNPPAQQGSGDVNGLGPSLRGVGAQAPDFYLRTGFMPLGKPSEQPYRKRVLLSEHEIQALVAYVAQLKAGPAIPRPRWRGASLPEGMHLFTEHCAGCHQIVAEGGIVTGARVPPIKEDTPTEIAEAVRIGPYLMPRFSQRQISDRQLNSIIAYLQASKHPRDRGGWGLGHAGPIPEGMVAWLLAGVVLVALCVLFGRRESKPE